MPIIERGYLRLQVPPPSAPDCCFQGRVIVSHGRSSFGSNGNPVNLWAHSTRGNRPHPLLWAGSLVVHGQIISGIPNRQYDCVISTVNVLTDLRTGYVLNLWSWSRKIRNGWGIYTLGQVVGDSDKRPFCSPRNGRCDNQHFVCTIWKCCFTWNFNCVSL